MIIQLVEIEAYDPGTASVVTLRYCSGSGYVTGPSETPANAAYLPRVINPGNFTRSLFSSGRTGGASQVGYGAIILANTDGGLDDLADYGFDGRTCTIREGEQGAAYTTFTVLFTGTVEQPEWSENRITLRLRDRQAELDKPLQATKYAGSNTLPAGVEGVEDLKDKPKPVLYGRCKNISPVCVNTSRQIWQVNDGAVNDVTAVRDNGVELMRAVSDLYAKITVAGVSGMVYSTYGNGKVCAASNAAVTTVGSLLRCSDNTKVLTFGITSGHAVRDVCFCSGNNYFYLVTFKSGTYTSLTKINSATDTKVGDVNIGLYSKYSTPISMDYCPKNDTLYVLTVTGYIYQWNVTAETVGAGINLGTDSLTHGVVRYDFDRQKLMVAYGTSSTATDKKIAIIDTTDDSIETQLLLHSQSYFPQGGHYDSATGKFYIAVGTNEILVFDCDQRNFAPSIFTVVKASGCHIDRDGMLWASGTSGATAFSQVINPDTNRTLFSNTDLSNCKRFAVVPSSANATYGAYLPCGSDYYIYNFAGTALADYTSQSDMETNEPDPGMFRVWPGGGMFRLGSTPAGTVTCDAQQGAAASNRTVAQLVRQVAEDRGGIASGDITSADITALDTANDAEVGFYASDETTVAAALDALSGSVGAWWGFDALGKFHIAQLAAPSGTEDLSITDAHMLSFQRVASKDVDKGIPAWKITVNYDRNWTVQVESAVAGYVSQTVKNWLAKEYRSKAASTASVKTTHLLSPEITVDTLMLDGTEAATEATRLQTLYGTRRDFLQVKLPRSIQADLFGLVLVTIARFGYDSGKYFRVIEVNRDFATGKNMITLWG